jgi:hypothetical protein
MEKVLLIHCTQNDPVTDFDPYLTDKFGGTLLFLAVESANLDDLYDDSYFHPILHSNVQKEHLELPTSQSSEQEKDTDDGHAGSDNPSPEILRFEVLTIPKECSWGDEHESLGSRLLVRPGYSAVLAAIQRVPDLGATTGNPQSIFMATGPPGIGKSCLAYYLVYKLFEAGHNVIISDPMFTNAFLDRQYYSCYSPHLDRHSHIFQAISSSSSTSSSASTSSPAPSKKATWWICDDGFLPIQGTHCNVFVTSSTTLAEKAVTTIHKKNKLVMPAQFQIPKWSMDEIKAGLIVSLSSIPGTGSSPGLADITIKKEQELVLQGLFTKLKGNPRKIFAWVRSNWVGGGESDHISSGGSKGRKSAGKSNKKR